MGEDEHRPGGWMKLLLITAFALLSAAPAAQAQADHFTVYKPWGNGEPVARDWYLRREPSGIVAPRLVNSEVISLGSRGRRCAQPSKGGDQQQLHPATRPVPILSHGWQPA